MNLLRRLLPGIALVMGAFLFSIGLQTLAFTEPSAGPTGGTVYAPLNTGPTAQTKNGNLTIGGQITITGGTPGAGKVLTSNASGLASWVTPSAGGVSQIIAGTNVTISPVGGTGAVTINASGGGGTGTVTSVGTNNGLTGGTIATIGTLGLNLTGISTCTNPTTNKIYWNGSYLACGTDQTGGAGGLSGSGSINYVPKWTGGTSLGNSQIYDNGTNVGIGNGMLSPWSQLDVGGNVGVNGVAFRAMDNTFSKYIFIAPSLGAGGYSGMSQSGDSGIFSAQNTGLVINPWNGSGGIRIAPNGDTRLGPGVFMNTGGYVYLNSTIDTQDVWLRNANRWATQMIDFSAAGSAISITPTNSIQSSQPGGISGNPKAAILNFSHDNSSCNDSVVRLYKGVTDLGNILGRVNNGEMDFGGAFAIVPLTSNYFAYKEAWKTSGFCAVTVRTIGFIY